MKSLPKLFLLLGFLFVSYVSQSQAFKLTDTISADPDVATGKLANGLTYFVKDNGNTFNNLQIRLVVNAGSLMEDDDQRGLAHFMEHMNFNGLKHFPKNELMSYLESNGLKLGADLNANTGYDATNYMLWMTTEDSKKIDMGFTIAEDWANNALLEPEEIDMERNVVLEESRLQKNVYSRMRALYLPTLFNQSRYAFRVPIGKDSIISNFPYDALTRYYKTWYRPDLMAVIVVGNLDTTRIKKEISKHFGTYAGPENEIPKPADIVLLPRSQDESMVLTDKEIQTTILELFGGIEKTPTIRTWVDLKQKATENLLTLMMNERLEALTRQANHSVIGAHASYDPLVKGYRSFNYDIAMGNNSVKEAVNAFISALQSVQQFGFLPVELERAKNTYAHQNEKQFLDAQKTGSGLFAEQYSEHFITGEPIISMNDRYLFIKHNLKSITLQDVNEIAKSIESEKGKFVLLMGRGNNESLPGNAGLLDLLAEARKAPVTPYTEQVISSTLLQKDPVAGHVVKETDSKELKTKSLIFSNGISVTLKPTDFKNDDIQMDAWRFGGSHNFGLANRQNAMHAARIVQSMGIQGFSKTDLDKFMSGKTISVQPYINSYEDGVEGKCSVNDFENFLQLIYAYYTAPAKDVVLYENYVNRQRDIFQNVKANPLNYFLDSTIRFQYRNSPWADNVPDPSDFNQINLDTAFAIYQQIFGNAYGMHFTFVGNLDVEKITPLLEKYLGGLPAVEKENKFTDEGLRPIQGLAEIKIKKGENKQSQVSLVFAGEAEVKPIETLKLDVLCEILNIRIMETLREKMGGIYTVRVNPKFSKRPYGHYNIGIHFTCGEENINSLLNALLDIIRDIRENGVDKKYLNYVKEMMTKHHAGLMLTNEYWLQTLSGSWIDRQDPGWALTYNTDVMGVSSSDLKKTAIQYFDMNNYLKEILVPE
jgi:zinc protease